jgi:glutamine synthetase
MVMRCHGDPQRPLIAAESRTIDRYPFKYEIREASVKQDALMAKFLTERGIEHVKIGVFDTDGVMRGKYISREKFLSGVAKNLGFCDVVLGWDSNDQLYDNTQFTGWHTAYPDATVRVLPDTQRDIPFEPKTVLFLGEFAGRAEAVCPRGTLRRVLARAAAAGYAVSAAAEFEFFVFDETPQSVREKGYRQLKTMTPGAFGYSVLRSSVHSDLYHELLDLSQAMRFPIEGLHTETGPGVLEAALAYCDALEAADRAALFKTLPRFSRSAAA